MKSDCGLRIADRGIGFLPPSAGGGYRRRGAALIIVLAFIVLLTGLIIAFFSRSVVDRQISNSSVNRAKVSAFADGAADAIIGELKEEIVLSSTPTTLASGTLYLPLTPAAMLPQLSGTTGITGTGLAAPNNLLKVSVAGQLFYSGTGYTGSPVTIPTSGASNVIAVSSTTPSLNGRSFTPAYWNQHYLLPLASPSTDSTPATVSFVPPSWILVARDGSNPTTFGSSMTASGANPVVGRYAFAIYHEGGLLDVNAAGYPSTTATNQSAYKSALSYADLTQLPGGLTTAQIDKLVAWRNYASIPVTSGSFQSPGFTAASGTGYYNMVVSNTTGFLTVNGTAVNSNQTDQMFSSRQQLIKFTQNGLGLSGTNLDVLNYLTTFSRDVNQPSYIPPVQSSSSAPVVLSATAGGNNAAGDYYPGTPYVSGSNDRRINPSFPTVRVQTSFTRNDGSMANIGDSLVNKRFALQRLAWITYKGPSADVIQTSGTSDPSIQPLIADGISYSYLLQGNDLNIKNYFGLKWDSTNNRWNYNVHNGAGSGKGLIMLVGRSGTAMTPDPTKFVEDANPAREPDFFELLKAGIAVGSLGKAAASGTASVNSSLAGGNAVPNGYNASEIPVNLRYNLDSSVDYHVIQIGANILSEVNPTSYPVRITFDDGTGARPNWEFQGVTDLPYLSYVFNGVLRTQLPNPAASGTAVDTSPFQYPAATSGTLTSAGNAYAIQVPAVWNPYDPNGTPGVLRPTKFKVLIDSNDPVSLVSPSGPPNHLVWCAGQASPRTAYGAPTTPGDNSGLGAPWIPGSVYSFQATSTTGSTSLTGTSVSDAVTFSDSNGLLYREPTLIFSASVGGATRTGTLGNITSLDANPLPGEADNSNGPWAPLVLGSFPLSFYYVNSNVQGTSFNTTSNPIMYAGTAAIGPGGQAGENRVYFTYRLQYQDPSGNWVTYDTKYGRTSHGQFSYSVHLSISQTVMKGPDGFDPYSWAAAIDPRTARFGLMTQIVNDGRTYGGINDPPPVNNNGPNGWVYNSNGIPQSPAASQGITYPIRPDVFAGFQFADLDNNDQVNVWPLNGNSETNSMTKGLIAGTSMTDVPYPSFSAGWTRPIMILGGYGACNVPIFAPGMYAQNSPSAPFYTGRYTGLDSASSSPVEPAYYADADGVVRRAAGAYVQSGANISASTPVGLPPASIQGYSGAPSSLVTPASTTPFTQSQSRPLLLHRPFRSVAELGYVFRDLPWKNLDFFTPESGDAGLLDMFCINDTSTANGIVAGKVNLNTRQAPVLTAILSGAYVDDPKITNTTVGSLSPPVPSAISIALVARTADTVNYGPLQNLSELVGKWNAAVALTGSTATLGTITYSPPSVPSANSGIDLPLNSGTDGYKDGKLSYVGFSGTTAKTSSGTAESLSDALATALSSNVALETSMSQIQRFREAPIRALASVGQTRVWNLMIDVVAQTGRYPQSASSLSQFLVEGQQHYWVHVAIDRLTGQVLDKQIEVVKE